MWEWTFGLTRSCSRAGTRTRAPLSTCQRREDRRRADLGRGAARAYAGLWPRIPLERDVVRPAVGPYRVRHRSGDGSQARRQGHHRLGGYRSGGVRLRRGGDRRPDVRWIVSGALRYWRRGLWVALLVRRLTLGGFAWGGVGIGIVALGGMAIGYFAFGGTAWGVHAMGGNGQDPVAKSFFEPWAYHWSGLLSWSAVVLSLFYGLMFLIVWLVLRRQDAKRRVSPSETSSRYSVR